MFEPKKYPLLYRRKLQFFLKPVVIISLIFIIYQLIMFIQLTGIVTQAVKSNLIRGTHEFQKQFYTANHQFTCIISMEKIDFQRVNDDYCDCLDGSDEPGTNACPNGQFFCDSQANYKHYPKVLPSSRVNDGVCDCCDGSDEWMNKELPFKFSNTLQHALQRYQSPCPNLCSQE